MKLENIITFLVIIITIYFVIANVIEASNYYKDIHIYYEIYR